MKKIAIIIFSLLSILCSCTDDKESFNIRSQEFEFVLSSDNSKRFEAKVDWKSDQNQVSREIESFEYVSVFRLTESNNFEMLVYDISCECNLNLLIYPKGFPRDTLSFERVQDSQLIVYQLKSLN